MKKRILSVAAALLTVGAGVSYAAIPSSDGVISACKDGQGRLKVIDAEAGQECPSNQQLLAWNQQGPAGPQGPPGPASSVGRLHINADGSVLNSTELPLGVVSTARTQTGSYSITWAGNHHVGCAKWLGFITPQVGALGNSGSGGDTTLVRVYDLDGALDDSGFTLYVSC
jgi:hypothetical protein